MANWQDYWKNEGQQKNQDLLDMLRARGGVYDRQNLGRIRAEEKMAQQRGTGVGAEYNPILGKPMVKDALGGVNSADWNIGGNIASGTPVQLMGRGFGIVADAKPSKPGDGDVTSAGNAANRTGSFSPLFLGGGGTTDNDSENVYVPGPDGSCELKNYAPGKAPKDSFKTLKECREAQDNEYICEEGVCKVAPKGTGKYKSLGECQAALVPAGFTGGQCDGVLYRVFWTVSFTSVFGEIVPGNTFSGAALVTGPVKGIVKDGTPRPPISGNPLPSTDYVYYVKGKPTNDRPDGKFPLPLGISGVLTSNESITSVQRVDNLPDNCGDPPKVCPS